MKKLMVAFAIAVVAVGVQAASFTWKTSLTGKVYTPGDSTTLLTSATAYLFDQSSVSQDSLVAAFRGGTLDLTTGYLSSQSISSGAIASTSFIDGTAVGSTLSAYFATLVTVDEKDYLFISATGVAAGLEGKTPNMSISGVASKNAAFDVAGGYQGAGWYTTQSVPEPTSGLLMLLGVAGLALRRRRV